MKYDADKMSKVLIGVAVIALALWIFQPFAPTEEDTDAGEYLAGIQRQLDRGIPHPLNKPSPGVEDVIKVMRRAPDHRERGYGDSRLLVYEMNDGSALVFDMTENHSGDGLVLYSTEIRMPER